MEDRRENITGTDITTRNIGLFNLSKHNVYIIGAGAIGSFTAKALVRSGCQRLVIQDHDVVGIENVGVQDYTISDIGLRKVDALSTSLLDLNPTAIIKTENREWKVRKDPQSLVVDCDFYINGVDTLILALDNMKIRKQIVKYYFKHAGKKDLQKLNLIDARMGSEVFQMYVFKPGWTLSDYLKTWYKDDESDREPCNARSTAYCAAMAGAYICNQVKKLAEDQTVEKELTFSFNGMILDTRSEVPEIKKFLKPPPKEEKETEIPHEILDNLDTDTSILFPDLPL
jgi:molybdopterin/thiamine biosynthesis adenylyltransferase